MNLLRLQELLARLYTEPVLRDQLFGHPDAFAEAMQLDAEELAYVTALSAQQVKMFAHVLAQKRVSMVKKLLPLAHLSLQTTFTSMFSAFAKDFVPRGARQHQEDALAFAAHILQEQPQELMERPWIRDFVRYDSSIIEAQTPGMKWQVRLFSYPVHHIAKELLSTVALESTEAIAHPRQKTLVVWHRLQRNQRLRVWIWPQKRPPGNSRHT